MDRDAWRAESEDLVTGVLEWRLQHPTATLTEIEIAIDTLLDRVRARLIHDVALASAAAHPPAPTDPPPSCPHCHGPLQARGTQTRHLLTQGDQTLALPRAYLVCPACGTGVFPPG